jgi:peptidoglycan biosynthesis protein MviN/MurJ (putative lipid II flippase)
MFFVNEVSANIYILVFNIIGFRFLGLEGLGISFMLGYFAYLLQVWIVCHKKYAFNFNSDFTKIFIIQLACAVACFCVVRFVHNTYQYIVGGMLIIASSIYSFKELDKRLELKKVILKFRK